MLCLFKIKFLWLLYVFIHGNLCCFIYTMFKVEYLQRLVFRYQNIKLFKILLINTWDSGSSFRKELLYTNIMEFYFIIRGHHIYIKPFQLGEELQCKIRKYGNVHDSQLYLELCGCSYYCQVLAKNISQPCHLFLHKGGIVSCVVIEPQYRAAQGGAAKPLLCT